MGFSLGQVKQAIDNGAALVALLSIHRDRVEQDIERLTHLHDRLRGLTDVQGMVAANDLPATLDAMARVERQVRSRNAGRRANSDDRELQWETVGKALRACMDAGDNPANDPARQVALQARSMIEDFAGGNTGTLQAVAHLRVADPPRDLAGWDPDLTRYLDRALASKEE